MITGDKLTMSWFQQLSLLLWNTPNADSQRRTLLLDLARKMWRFSISLSLLWNGSSIMIERLDFATARSLFREAVR